MVAARQQKSNLPGWVQFPVVGGSILNRGWQLGPFGGFFTNVAVVAGGGAHSLAIRANGRVFAWGSNSSGQLGDGSGVDQSVPVTVVNLGGIGEFTRVPSFRR